MTYPISPADPRVGYLDFLTLVYAYLPHNKTYTPDAIRWARAIVRIKEQFGHANPELFRGIRFIEHPNNGPYSPEVSEFLTFLQYGSLVEVLNPGFTRLRIHREAQSQLKQQLERTVPEQQRLLARQIAEAVVSDTTHGIVA